MATIGGKTGELKMTIDYTNFQEVKMAIECAKDNWKSQRQLKKPKTIENAEEDNWKYWRWQLKMLQCCNVDQWNAKTILIQIRYINHIEGVSTRWCLWPSLRPLVQEPLFLYKLKIFDLPFLILKTRCDGREMVDGVPTVPDQLSYTAEVQKIMIFVVIIHNQLSWQRGW